MDTLTTEEQRLALEIRPLREWCDSEFARQHARGQLNVTNRWVDGDGAGEEFEQIKGQRGGHSGWKLMSLPPQDQLFDRSGRVLWEPKYVRLTDDAAIVSICIHDKQYRATFLPWDFDSKGEIRKIRVPIGPTITIMQNGLKTIPVWKDWYAFTGGTNNCGWLLSSNPGPVNRFTAGLILPAKEPTASANITLDSYEPQAGSLPINKWTEYARDNKIYFEGNQRVSYPVLIITEKGGMIGTLQGQKHFHPKICQSADEDNPYEICLRNPNQTEEEYEAALHSNWTEEITPERTGTRFKWEEIAKPHPSRYRKTKASTAAATPAKRRKTKPITLTATTPTASSTPEPEDSNANTTQPAGKIKVQTRDAATMTDDSERSIDITTIPAPEVHTETQQNLATLQSFYNLARLEAAQSFPVLMTAASRLEALAASCAASKKALQFLRLAGQNSMTDTEATTLLQRTKQQMLPTYMNDTLSNIVTEADAAHIRDAIHFAQSLPAFSAAVSSEERDDLPVDIFRRLRNEWAKLLPANSDSDPETTPR
ncbi:hypothetical protein N7516_010703 [Penicillium verrucosum]|uniref:uncharacterized protein n=1 Tax=Penicillium verrucosum TaxID=60171 RepID=UPI002545A626|nr:uncharacterized protein N7516_010703 [Penicillium verrucosum]KAJ5923000.1 hypothetical protein N7516_010703 [Penicillium verrucosum]